MAVWFKASISVYPTERYRFAFLIIISIEDRFYEVFHRASQWFLVIVTLILKSLVFDSRPFIKTRKSIDEYPIQRDNSPPQAALFGLDFNLRAAQKCRFFGNFYFLSFSRTNTREVISFKSPKH